MMALMKRTFSIVVLALVLACAPRVQEPGATQAPPALTQETFVTSDAGNHPLRVWHAEGEERAVFVALHGFNDYSHAFTEPARWWAKRGISTYAYDQRGFGGTANKGIWPGSALLKRDLEEMVRLVRTRHPDTPHYLLGESMGAAVIMSALAEEGFPPVDGAILSAPAVWGWQNLDTLYRVGLWFGAHVMPWNRATGSGLGIQASDNIELLKSLGRDPMVIKNTRIDAVYGLVSLMDEAFLAADALDERVLVLYGLKDELVPRPAVELMLKRLAEPKTVAVYPDGWHLLLRDLQADVVLRDIASWALDPGMPLPSGLTRSSPPYLP